MSNIEALARKIDCDNALVMLPIIADAFEEEGDADSAEVIRHYSESRISFYFYFHEQHNTFVSEVSMKSKGVDHQFVFKIGDLIPFTLETVAVGRIAKLSASTIRKNSLVMKAVALFALTIRYEFNTSDLELLYRYFLGSYLWATYKHCSIP